MGDEVIFSPVQAENRWGRAASLVVPLVVSLRPWQWAKNSVVLLPLVFTIDQDLRGRDFDSAMDLAGRALAGFAVFCIMSSSVYLINDILDRRRDIAHPKKRHRPIPSGALSVRVAFWTAVAFALLSLTAALALNTEFGIITGLYFAMNLSYSVYFKRVVILDLLLVAGGYVVRLAAGTLLLETATSPWLYTTIGLGALVIVLSKRRSEVLGAGEGASAQRPVLNEYPLKLLQRLPVITGIGMLLVYALYVSEADTLPADRSMFLTIPFVVFSLFRYLHLAGARNEGESPELIILKDPPLLLAILLWMVTGVSILTLNR